MDPHTSPELTRPDDELIVNVTSGEVLAVDPFQVAGRGMPDGFHWMDDVSKTELAARIKELT